MAYQNLKLGLLFGGSLLLVPTAALAAHPGPFGRDAGVETGPLGRPREVAQPQPLAQPQPQQSKDKLPDTSPRTTALDRATVQKLHDANQMEIQMGSLAKEKGSTKAVREFGRQLIADHTAADHRLDGYLRRHASDIKTLATTTGADSEHELLATKTGTDFDRAFGLQMIADHTKVIAIIESARIDTADSELRELFEILLPTLQAHKKTAQDIVVASARS
jgi:putative membrane protein